MKYLIILLCLLAFAPVARRSLRRNARRRTERHVEPLHASSGDTVAEPLLADRARAAVRSVASAGVRVLAWVKDSVCYPVLSSLTDEPEAVCSADVEWRLTL